MLWFGKQAEAAREVGDKIQPAALKIGLDAKICAGKLSRLREDASELGGVESFVQALNAKHALFEHALAVENVDTLEGATFETLLECIFPARRKLPSVLLALEHGALAAAVKQLLYESGPLADRMAGFVDALAAGTPKQRRAAWDLAAELVHFRAPDQYPLMTHWVWDPNTLSGAVREFIRGNDTLADIPLDGTPESFEGCRVWFAGQLAAEGYYRDVPLLIDLLLAQAYADYLRAMASGIGMLTAELGARNDPLEILTKLLGIDPPRREGRSRIKK